MTFTDKIIDMFDKYGKEVVSEMQTRLKGHGKVASGTLLNSIGYESRLSSPGVAELAFFMADYGIYVDKGRPPGKQPPLSKIQEWCKIKGIPESAAFPIARNIGKFGIKLTNFFTVSVERRREQFNKKISDITAEYVKEQIKESIK